MKFICILILTLSCSTIKERNKKRDVQSGILQTINAQTDRFSHCAKYNELFSKFESERIRVELQMFINNQGQVEKFQLDNKPYPDQFVECLFNIVDVLNFPKLNQDEAVDMTIPIIFSK